MERTRLAAYSLVNDAYNQNLVRAGLLMLSDLAMCRAHPHM